jgi:hypothetical protein
VSSQANCCVNSSIEKIKLEECSCICAIRRQSSVNLTLLSYDN